MADIVKVESGALATPALTREDIDTLRNTVCAGLNDAELKLFVAFCASRGFHPLDKRIAPFKSSGKMTMVTTIDAKRTIAHRTGLYDGMDGPYFCGEDGAWRDVWLAKTRPAACKVTVYRKGCAHPFTAILLANEYKGGAVAGQMPNHMLAKATESLALSKAFPEEAGSLYTDDEIPEARGATRYVEAAPQPNRLTLTSATQPAAEPLPESIGSVYTPDPPADDFSEPPSGPVYVARDAANALYARALRIPAPFTITKKDFVDMCGANASEVTPDSFEIMSDLVAKREAKAAAAEAST